MDGFLDACVSYSDVKAASMLMIMSQTFFKARKSSGKGKAEQRAEGGGGGSGPDDSPADDAATPKEFVQRTISHHPLWKDPVFWEEVKPGSDGTLRPVVSWWPVRCSASPLSLT